MVISRLVTALAASVLVLPRPAGAGDADIRRFLGEYPQAAARLMAAYGTARCEYHPAGTDAYRMTAAMDGGRRLELYRGGRPDKAGEVVTCIDGERLFIVAKKQGADAYTLHNLEPADPRSNPTVGRLDPVLSAPFAVDGTPFIQFVEASVFRVVAAEPESCDDQDCIRVEYEVANSGDTPPDRGAVVLDPGLDWAIRRSEIGPGVLPGAMIRHEVVYEEDRGGIPVPREVKVVNLDRRGARYAIDAFAFEPTPDERFTLEYYGIPDPGPVGDEPGSAGASRPNRLAWITGAGVVGLIVAAWLRRLGRR